MEINNTSFDFKPARNTQLVPISRSQQALIDIISKIKSIETNRVNQHNPLLSANDSITLNRILPNPALLPGNTLQPSHPDIGETASEPLLFTMTSFLNYFFTLKPEPIRPETQTEINAFNELDFGDDILKARICELPNIINHCFKTIYLDRYSHPLLAGKLIPKVGNPIQKNLHRLADQFCNSQTHNQKIEIIDSLLTIFNDIENKIHRVTNSPAILPLSSHQRDALDSIYSPLDPKESTFFQDKMTLCQYRRTLLSQEADSNKRDTFFYTTLNNIHNLLKHFNQDNSDTLSFPEPYHKRLASIKEIANAHYFSAVNTGLDIHQDGFYLSDSEHEAIVDFCNKFANGFVDSQLEMMMSQSDHGSLK